MTLTVGSLCTGTAAVELALAQVLGAEPLWFADPDPGAVALLQHRYPNTPNLGDLTKVDWRAIRRPDIIAVGFPCQDISAAGLQAGMRPGNRSGLWFWIVHTIAELRPTLVVIENVRALLTARGAPPTPELIAAWAELERYGRVLTLIEAKLDRATKRAQRDRIHRLAADRVRIMGRHRRAVGAVKRADARIVRALGTVLGDLADLGFDAEWVMLPASGVDAPHQRQRVFIVAAAADAGRVGVQRWADGRGMAGPQGTGASEGLQRQRGRDATRDAGAAAPDTAGVGWEAGAERRGPGDEAGGGWPDDRGSGEPAPDAGGPVGRRVESGDVGDDGGETLRLGPAEPRRRGGAAPDTEGDGRPAQRLGERTAPERPGTRGGSAPAADPEGDGRGEGRPEPIGEGETGTVGDRGGTAPDTDGGGLPEWAERDGEPVEPGLETSLGDDLVGCVLDWAAYAPAIERWERVLGRAAPAPTVLGARGAMRLNPRFVEWMMGLPAGWVTEVPGITRNLMLKMLGNGVVPQQAEAALRHLLPLLLAERVAA
jgi:DNA (cytosine-5)-methyltransferase 1